MIDYPAAARTRIWQFGTSHRKMARTGGPVVFDTADGCHLVDSTGRRYIDALSGVWVVNAGHHNPDIVKAMAAQASRLGYALSEEGFANTAAVDLATRLTDVVDGVYDRVYFTTGGSESVEMALRMARLYHSARGRPGKRTVISRQGSYHGATLFTLGLSAYDIFSRAVGPLPEGIAKVVHPTCADCPLGLSYPRCGVACAQDLADTIERLGPDTVAAFVAEPVSTSAGVAVPPPGYWPAVREICSRYDVLLVADEVVTGIGRCGDVLATRRFGIEADIVALAKALTSGYAPLGAVLTHRDITAGMPTNALLIPGFTFTGHPIACAAATANLDILCRPEVYDGVLRKSARLEKALDERLRGRPHVGGIRVFGLLAAVDIAPPPAARGRHVPSTAELSQLMSGWLLESGLYTRVVEGCIQLGPPLLAPDDLMDAIADHLAAAFDRLADHLGEDPVTTLDRTDVDLVRDLKEALDLREVARPVDHAGYLFTMDNDFVSPNGHVLRRQRLRAGYTRRLTGALSPRTAMFGFTWNWVEFSSVSVSGARTATQDPIRWTFAAGRTFDYYRPFPVEVFPTPGGNDHDAAPVTDRFHLGDWYTDLAALPAVNLLVMATWDVLTFEALTGVLACEGLGEYGVRRPVSTMDGTQVHFDFKGFALEDSSFENAAVHSHPTGLTLVGDTPCTGVAFQGVGRLEVGGGGTGRSQQGESYFLGTCLLSTGEADLVSGEMTELLMVSMKNAAGRHVPMQKRRVVRISRADQR